MSIKKIAAQAGVSYVTVSRALNHPEKVDPETRARIQKIFKELSFKPRVIPNSLDTVNFLLPSPEHINASDGLLFSYIAASLAGKGYHTVVSPWDIRPIQNLFHRAYVAILREGDEKIASFIREHAAALPFVIIDDTIEPVSDDAVFAGSDHRHGTTCAIEYLSRKGHARIGYVGSSPTSRGFREKFETYKELMGKNKCYDEDCVFINEERFLFEGLKRLCGKGVTALFIAEENLTLKTIYHLDQLGKKVPDDISVVSKEIAGNIEFLYPPITCIIQPLRKLSVAVVDLVLRRIRDRDASVPRRTYIPYDFIERESVRRMD